MAKKIVKIDFNSVIKKIILPLDYKSFLVKIQKILNINSDLISFFEFKYNDKYGKITFNSDGAYDNFIDDINSETILSIIYNNQNPDLDIDSCTKSFENFDENINDNDINNNNNESNNDSMDNSNMNMIKKNEDYISLLNKNINKKEKNNNIITLFISIKINWDIYFSETFLAFFELCSSCYEYPLLNTIYYCLQCKISICDKCEKNDGFNHRHTLLKIQTREQYNDLIYNIFIEENPNQSRLKQIYYYLKYYTYRFFSKKRFPELMNRIQLFRAKYNILNNIKDIKLKNALIKAIGNMDEAFKILKNNNL